METTDSAYPVRFDIDYPEEPRHRLTVAFRLILVIPILIGAQCDVAQRQIVSEPVLEGLELHLSDLH